MKVVHYINQFFAGIGGEEQADLPPEVRPRRAGPGPTVEHASAGGFTGRCQRDLRRQLCRTEPGRGPALCGKSGQRRWGRPDRSGSVLSGRALRHRRRSGLRCCPGPAGNPIYHGHGGRRIPARIYTTKKFT